MSPGSAHAAVGATPLAGRLHICHGAGQELVVALQSIVVGGTRGQGLDGKR